jgi:Tfp pilus assembly protein PilN
MPDKVYVYLLIFGIFSVSFIVAKFMSWMTAKDRPVAKLSWSLLSTNCLLCIAIIFGSATIFRQWQDIDDMEIRLQMLEEESLLKCPAPLFKHQVPPQHPPPLNQHHGNQLPEIFLKERPKEVWL